MKGLSIEEIMGIALELVDETEIPLDSGIHVPGENIKKLIFTMDANVGLLHMANDLGFDAVVCHHPCGVLPHRGEVYRKHVDLMEKHGIPREEVINALREYFDTVVRRIENKRFRMLYYESPNQTVKGSSLLLTHLNFHKESSVDLTPLFIKSRADPSFPHFI